MVGVGAEAAVAAAENDSSDLHCVRIRRRNAWGEHSEMVRSVMKSVFP